MAAITISRQYGSGGRKVALKVSELLGWPVFDKRLMIDVASEVGLLPADVIDFTEDDYKVKNFWDRLLGSARSAQVADVPSPMQITYSPVTATTFTSEEMDQEGAVLLVNRAIMHAYERGNVIIVGRGGQIILQDEPDVLHVRVRAPMHVRMRRLAEYERIPAQDTLTIAQQHDKAAIEYMRMYFDADWDDTNLYHMVINSGKLSTSAIANLIVASAKQYLAMDT